MESTPNAVTTLKLESVESPKVKNKQNIIDIIRKNQPNIPIDLLTIVFIITSF